MIKKSVVEYKRFGIMFCPSTYGITVNYQCVLYTMYVQVYMLFWWIINVYYMLCMSKYTWYYGESSKCTIYYVCPSIHGIMVNHQSVLYIMYVQVYMVLWWIINLYYILCMSKYMCYFSESSMCTIYNVYPSIHGIMVNYKCLLYIMYVKVYMVLWWIINLYNILCISKYTWYYGEL